MSTIWVGWVTFHLFFALAFALGGTGLVLLSQALRGTVAGVLALTTLVCAVLAITQCDCRFCAAHQPDHLHDTKPGTCERIPAFGQPHFRIPILDHSGYYSGGVGTGFKRHPSPCRLTRRHNHRTLWSGGYHRRAGAAAVRDRAFWLILGLALVRRKSGNSYNFWSIQTTAAR